MSDIAALERRYRRMLIWFPAEHRRIYGEEMIGVLLASASDDENRPGLADMTDIALWGLRTRLRGWLRAGRVDTEWGDALAAFAVAAPLLMTAFLADQLYHVVRFEHIVVRLRFLRTAIPFDFATELTSALLMLVAAVTAVVALAIGPAFARRRQRLAVTLTAAVPVLLGAVAVVYFDVTAGSIYDVPVGYTAFFVTELIAVVLAPDLGRGWRVLTRKGLIVVVAAAALTVLLEELLQHGILDSVISRRSIFEVIAVIIGIALILIFGSAAHKRMLALLAIVGYPLLAYGEVSSYFYPLTEPSGFDALLLPTLAIALLVGLAIWQSSRRAARPPATPSG